MVISKVTLITLRNAERSARFMMGGVAITSALIGLSIKAGLVSNTPSYDRQSWYLVTKHRGFTVTTQLNMEADCRKQENDNSVCRSGNTMMGQLVAVPVATSDRAKVGTPAAAVKIVSGD